MGAILEAWLVVWVVVLSWVHGGLVLHGAFAWGDEPRYNTASAMLQTCGNRPAAQPPSTMPVRPMAKAPWPRGCTCAGAMSRQPWGARWKLSVGAGSRMGAEELCMHSYTNTRTIRHVAKRYIIPHPAQKPSPRTSTHVHAYSRLIAPHMIQKQELCMHHE